MPAELTPAARAALAFLAITGDFPKGTHVDTRIACLDYRENVSPLPSGGYPKNAAGEMRFYDVPAEHAPKYEHAPLWRVHAALLAAGFAFKGRHSGNRRWLTYERAIDADGETLCATVWPDGYLYGERGNVFARARGRQTESVSKRDAGKLPAIFGAAA